MRRVGKSGNLQYPIAKTPDLGYTGIVKKNDMGGLPHAATEHF